MRDVGIEPRQPYGRTPCGTCPPLVRGRVSDHRRLTNKSCVQVVGPTPRESSRQNPSRRRTLPLCRGGVKRYPRTMARHTLRIDRAQLNTVGMNHARKLVNRVVRRTFNRSQVLVPVDTGLLRASGRIEPASPRGLTVVGGIVYDAEYAAAVHNGRGALTIRAKGGGRLRFVVDGRVVYARQVHQPARTGRPYLATALREVGTAEGFRVTIG